MKFIKRLNYQKDQDNENQREIISILSHKTLKDITYHEPKDMLRGIFTGVVLKITRLKGFITYLISDGQATAEATVRINWAINEKVNVQNLEFLPKIGQSAEMIGKAYKKVFGKIGTINKIIVSSIQKISLKQELQNLVEAQKLHRQCRNRPIYKNVVLPPKITEKLLNSQEQKIKIRNALLSIIFYVFEQNTDINSYTFNAEVIRISSQGKKLMEIFQTNKHSFENGIDKVLLELEEKGVVKGKHINEGQKKKKFYVFKREKFDFIENLCLKKIQEYQQKGGITIHVLSNIVNQRISNDSIFKCFDWNFLQLILRKMDSNFLIYKTSDKIIYPNYKLKKH